MRLQKGRGGISQAVTLLVLLLTTCIASGGASPRYSNRGHYTPSHAHVRSQRIGYNRDSRGRILRSTTARNEFKRQHPCPATGRSSGSCPGSVIDHVVPLKRHGADAPGNMQWQTVEAAKAKDKIE
jgi:hypothetical protein